MIEYNDIKKIYLECQQCLTIIVVTVASMLSGVIPDGLTVRKFVAGFLASLSFVLVGWGVAEYFSLGSVATIATSFLFGRFSYLIETQIEMIIKMAPERFRRK